MSDPATGVTAGGVVMRPVHDSAAVVRLELTRKRHRIAFSKVGDTRGQIDVVCNEHGAPRRQPNDEPLMLRPCRSSGSRRSTTPSASN